MNDDSGSDPRHASRLDGLLHLMERRWSIPVLALLYEASGAKFVTLANRLGVSRGTLSATLNHLIDLGLVRRNEGHGHPMRPEYLLTERGGLTGQHCAALAEVVDRGDDADLAYRKWTLPLIAAIGDRTVRFRDLSESLATATPRAITLGLKRLLDGGWIGRSLIDDYPPAAGYHLLRRGQRVYARLDLLCSAAG